MARPTHYVAGEVIASDRAQAGEVMVAKATVEQLIAAGPTDADELADALNALAFAARQRRRPEASGATPVPSTWPIIGSRIRPGDPR